MYKILIADDETNILKLLQIILQELDAEIITAENGEIAISKAKEHHPDLIISAGYYQKIPNIILIVYFLFF